MIDQPSEQAATARPKFHFTAPVNWLNDPNGLVFLDGEYHLFYQHHPFENMFGPPHWGHASSRDLVVWEHRPIALAPDDLGWIFSGSAVIDVDNTAGFGAGALVAAFTHHLEEGVESQSLAFSLDGGHTFAKYAGNPVVKQPEGVPDFRDPRILWWHGEATGHWVMLLAVGVSVWVYTSNDLIDWEYASTFDPDPGSARVWECPDLTQLSVANTGERRWVMAVGVDSGDLPALYGTRYWVGDFDGRKFIQAHTAVHWADHGADFYAAQSWNSAPDDRKVWIGWMNNWGYARDTPTEGWRGAMTVPRELGLIDTADGIRLTQQPVAELEAHRVPLVDFEALKATGDSNPLATVQGSALDIVAAIDLQRSTAKRLRLAVRTGPGESTEIVLDLGSPALSVDRFRSGRHLIHRSYTGPRLAALDLADHILDLRVLVDTTSVEVFAGGGIVAITEQIFPSPDSTGLGIETDEGTVFFESLRVYGIETPR